ncbi:hypothetical protein NEOLI_005250 [Neolecta irregularis DAH-3]|uniref:SnoaL-like domain-containing protein n=1 Tax=Neolecta irregularis (strain DAH-3) TaxID=1198029 RepID=A0A1U7LL40_NEOID|nr:hypothetical protein NEOLI_005250 [Neolecta irregularis DAH-3]|eukprot:OLL23375.1 hypothetical protein NEOLI_005250 [Neolecta irregularis DAH-3]
MPTDRPAFMGAFPRFSQVRYSILQAGSLASAAAENAFRFHKHLIRGELDKAVLECHPDFVVEESPGLPYDKQYYEGLAGLQELLLNMAACMEMNDTRVEVFPVSEELVFIAWNAKCTTKQTNQTFNLDLINKLDFRDNKIIKIKSYYLNQSELLLDEMVARQGMTPLIQAKMKHCREKIEEGKTYLQNLATE